MVQGEIAKMEAEYEALMAYIDQLSEDKERCERRLVNAGKLLALLSDEGERWAATVEVLHKEVEKIVGNVFLAASSISYMGPFTVSRYHYNKFIGGIQRTAARRVDQVVPRKSCRYIGQVLVGEHPGGPSGDQELEPLQPSLRRSLNRQWYPRHQE